MGSFSKFFKKLGLFVRRDRFASELEEEMALHRELRAKELMAGGMEAREARETAARQFGNATQSLEESHDAISFGFETAAQDLKFAGRQLRKNPGFAATAVLILALGIGASTTIFAFVDAILVRPLPYPNPSQLVAVGESIALIPRAPLSYADYVDWNKTNTSFRSFDSYTGRSFLLPTPSGTERVSGVRVTDGFFGTLGVNPLLGRAIQPGDDAAKAQIVVLSYSAWQKHFGGRRDIVGQTATLSGVAFMVVGVLPQSFQFEPMGNADFWSPMEPLGPCESRRSCHNLGGIARLKDGVSTETASLEMKAIAAQLEKQYPDSNHGQSGLAYPFREEVVGNVRPILLLLMGGAALLLLIACVNVTSLLMARSENRKREIAVRGALGASFSRLVRQFATEGMVLVTVGGGLGIAGAAWAMRLLMKLVPPDMTESIPALRDLGMGGRVFAYAVGVSLLAALLFAVVPVIRMPSGEMKASMAEGGRGSSIAWRRFGSNLVVAELIIATVLLVGAGLLAKSLYRVLRVPLGFNPEQVATLLVSAPLVSYAKNEQQAALARRVVSELKALPGVQSAAVTTIAPVSFNGNTDWIRFSGRPYNGEHLEVNERDVSPEYFTTLQARLLRGRFFTAADEEAGHKVAVINRTLAEKYFPGADPIGQKYGDIALSPDSMKEIVGVVDDIREGTLDSDIWPAEYLPFSQDPDSGFVIVTRTSQDPGAALPMMMAAVRKIDPGIATMFDMTMNEKIGRSSTAYFHRSAAWVVGAFSGLALMLSAVGLYGVISYSVSQRRREIGVRMALGAGRRAVYRLVLGNAGRVACAGIVIGLVCSVIAARMMGNLLFGVASWDAATLGSVGLLLAAVSVAAAYAPARRAAALDPMEVLRAE
jgi:macrolide transport system ATP-binding/permease protein